MEGIDSFVKPYTSINNQKSYERKQKKKFILIPNRATNFNLLASKYSVVLSNLCDMFMFLYILMVWRLIFLKNVLNDVKRNFSRSCSSTLHSMNGNKKLKFYLLSIFSIEKLYSLFIYI